MVSFHLARLRLCRPSLSTRTFRLMQPPAPGRPNRAVMSLSAGPATPLSRTGSDPGTSNRRARARRARPGPNAGNGRVRRGALSRRVEGPGERAARRSGTAGFHTGRHRRPGRTDSSRQTPIDSLIDPESGKSLGSMDGPGDWVGDEVVAESGRGGIAILRIGSTITLDSIVRWGIEEPAFVDGNPSQIIGWVPVPWTQGAVDQPPSLTCTTARGGHPECFVPTSGPTGGSGSPETCSRSRNAPSSREDHRPARRPTRRPAPFGRFVR